jgi:antitoxin HicB
MTNKYPFNIAWSEEDKEYVATCPSFPGLSAYGVTEEKALAEAKVALNLFIKSCEERSIPLPEPHVVQDYSGQFRVRIPKSLHAQAARMAEEEDTSLNQFVLGALAERVGGKKIHDQTMKELKRTISDLVTQNRMPAYVPNWPEPGIPGKIEYIKETHTTTKESLRTATTKDVKERGQ